MEPGQPGDNMIPVFMYSETDLVAECDISRTQKSIPSKFDTLLGTTWDSAMHHGYFRYPLTQLDTRVIPGEKQYVAQLNVKRGVERRTPQAIQDVNQPFNPALFNFTKIKTQEILFHLKRVDDDESKLLSCNSLPNGDTDCVVESREESLSCPSIDGRDTQNRGCHLHSQTCQIDKSPVNEDCENLVIINASPFEYGHVLIVPDVNGHHPQILTEQSIQIGIEAVLLSTNPGFKVCFNSLCAFASVNHLHLHAYYTELPIRAESCPASKMCGECYELTDTPVRGFAFQLCNSSAQKISRFVHRIVIYFQESGIAHNLFITHGGTFDDQSHRTQKAPCHTSSSSTVRLLLWPRKSYFGAKDDTVFNAAVAELAGHLPCKDEPGYHSLTQEEVDRNLAAVSLDEEEFEMIKQDIQALIQNEQLTNS